MALAWVREREPESRHSGVHSAEPRVETNHPDLAKAKIGKGSPADHDPENERAPFPGLFQLRGHDMDPLATSGLRLNPGSNGQPRLPSGLSQTFARASLARRTHPFLTERGRELGADADDCASSIAVARMGPSALSLLPDATASPARRSIASVPRSRRLELAELHLQRGEPSGEMWRAASLAMAQRLWLTTSTLCPSGSRTKAP